MLLARLNSLRKGESLRVCLIKETRQNPNILLSSQQQRACLRTLFQIRYNKSNFASSTLFEDSSKVYDKNAPILNSPRTNQRRQGGGFVASYKRSIQITSPFLSPEALPVATKAGHDLLSSTGFGGGGGLAGSGLVCRRHLHSSAAVGRRPILLGKHVREALANGQPVVALESTVITHGLPEPENLRLALSLEEIVANFSNISHKKSGKSLKQQNEGEGEENRTLREAGSSVNFLTTPATVGIVKGQLVVGLSRDEIEFLASKNSSRPIKASRRDIPIAMALGLSAGTTVSATMAIACSVRNPSSSNFATGNGSGSGAIKVFATGGTGGVHNGGELSMDISADLYEFARSPIGVVSSGFKSFLDTRRSLEVLETFGCPVVSMGKAGDLNLFPAFFCRSNWLGIKSPRVLEGGPEEAARVLFYCLEASPLENKRAMLLANPIPSEFALDNFSLASSSSQDNNLHPSRQKKKKEPETSENNGLLAGASLQPTNNNNNADNNREQDGANDKRKLDKNQGLEETLASISAEIDKRADLEGRDKTPLILERLAILTGGQTLRANMELLKSNAAFGAQLAYEYGKLANRSGCCILPAASDENMKLCEGSSRNDYISKFSSPPKQRELSGSPPKASGPVVVGCTMIDMHVSTKIDDHFKNNPPHSGVTFEGRPHLTLGGVGRNLACAIELLGHKPTFITSLGNDNLASFALSELEKIGLTRESRRLLLGGKENSDMSIRNEKSELSCCFALVLVDSISGLSEYVIANLEAVKAISRQTIEDNLELIAKSPLVVMDANLESGTMAHLIERCHERNVPIFLEPTDKLALEATVKSLKFLQVHRPDCLTSLLCLSPNLLELEAMLELFGGENNSTRGEEEMSLEQVEHLARKLMDDHLPQLKCLLVTLDKRGVLVAVRQAANSETFELDDDEGEINKIKLLEERGGLEHENNPSRLLTKHFQPPLTLERPVSASGAGDSFAAGFISGLLAGSALEDCLAKGFQAALLTLQDKNNISPKLTQIAIK